MDNLQKHGLILVDWCCMCKRSGESVDHLLYCSFAQELWSMIFGLFGVNGSWHVVFRIFWPVGWVV
jgi:hypothetical protein